MNSRSSGIHEQEKELSELAHRLGGQFGLSCNWDRIRTGTNHVFSSCDNNFVMRVHINDPLDLIERTTIAANMLSGPCSVLPPLTLEVATEGKHGATLWKKCEIRDEKESSRGLVEAIESLDKANPELFSSLLKRANILVNVPGRIKKFSDGNTVPREYVEYFEKEYSRLLPIHERMMQSTDHVIHCDAWTGNVVYNNGRPLLVDMDEVSLGPKFVDAIPMAFTAKRFLKDDSFNLYLEKNGRGILDWEFFDDAVSMRELVALTWIANLYNFSEESRKECDKRMGSILHNSEYVWK